MIYLAADVGGTFTDLVLIDSIRGRTLVEKLPSGQRGKADSIGTGIARITAEAGLRPSDVDLFATLTMLTERFAIDYAILHTCTLDSMGHRFGHDCHEMDHACYAMDGMLAAFLPRWLDSGYEVIVTADHGQTDRGHHGGREDLQQDFALYYFGAAKGPKEEVLLDQLQLAPSILKRLGVKAPATMKAKAFLG